MQLEDATFRRRQCVECGRVFSTLERVALHKILWRYGRRYEEFVKDLTEGVGLKMSGVDSSSGRCDG